MECKQFCPLSLSLIFVPLFRSTGSDLIQSVDAQLPGWVWLIFVCLALVAIYWWQIYLRPRQEIDVHELEHYFADDHSGHTHAGEHEPAKRSVDEKPEQDKSGLSVVSSGKVGVDDFVSLAETSEASPDHTED